MNCLAKSQSLKNLKTSRGKEGRKEEWVKLLREEGGKKKKLNEHSLWARLHLALFFLTHSVEMGGGTCVHLQIRKLRHGTVNKVVKVSWVTGFELKSVWF